MYLFWSRPFLDVKNRYPVKLAQVKSGFYCRIQEAISQACHQNQKLFSLMLRNHSFSPFGFPIVHPAQYGHQLWLCITCTPLSFSCSSSGGGRLGEEGTRLAERGTSVRTELPASSQATDSYSASGLNVLESVAHPCFNQVWPRVSTTSIKHT